MKNMNTYSVKYVSPYAKFSLLTSNCCGGRPIGQVINGQALCSRCKEHADFDEGNNER
jgi:hypothetical protein